MDEQSLRAEVATCIKLLVAQGLIDFSGHVSARIPGTEEILINSRELSRNAVKPGDLLRLTLEGALLEGEGRPPLELALHTAVYRARPDVQAVAHIHPPRTVALSISRKQCIPVIYHGAIFGAQIPVYDDCRHINSRERGDAMASSLGIERAVIIRGHGATLVADSVKGVFLASIYLEDNADKLCQAYSMGEPQALSPQELAEGPRIWTELQFNKVWNYYLKKNDLI